MQCLLEGSQTFALEWLTTEEEVILINTAQLCSKMPMAATSPQGISKLTQRSKRSVSFCIVFSKLEYADITQAVR
jgi:hypothetical protein